jgi:hypothetical protein
VTIRANLDDQLRPVAATLLSVNDRRFTSSTFLDRLLGKHGEGFRGLSPLHTVLDLPEGGGLSGSQSSQRDVNPFIDPLFRDLAKVLDSVCGPMGQALRQYDFLYSGVLAALLGDLAFHLVAVRLMECLRSQGLPNVSPGHRPHDRACLRTG